ncbi:SAF domain-containing protein [Propionibacterium freudenreichii]|uniref:SAF domain-containing protein n=1 Tax=Propionibacterium freudenreichii TaxID=1744 RepID=UPI000A268B8A
MCTHGVGVTPPAWLNSLVRAVRWHRRGLGLIAAAICVVAVLTALDPSASSSHTVVIASRPLAAGVAVGADDVTTLQVPAEVATSATLADPGAAIGQVVAVPAGRHGAHQLRFRGQGAGGRLRRAHPGAVPH